MPAVKRIDSPTYQLLVWRIEEDLSFFAQAITLNAEEALEYGQISHKARKLEWMAARYVQRKLYNDYLVKDQWGKPHLASSSAHISIAHCTHYAAAIYSKVGPVGVDVEPIHEKVQRIANKFLSEGELQLLDSKNLTASLIAAWSVKEAIYKWYGKKELSFKRNIQLQEFSLDAQKAKVLFALDNQSTIKEVKMVHLEEVILAFV